MTTPEVSPRPSLDSPRRSTSSKHRRRSSWGNLHRSFSRMGSSSSSAQIDLAAGEAVVSQQLTGSERRQLADDGEVARYVKACNGNHNEALKRLRATFAWRARERPEALRCTVCEADPKAHFMHVVGHDQLGRPVIYSCLKNAKNRRTEDNQLHMLATFQQAIRMMPPGVSQWVWAADFHGFGMKDVDPTLARVFLTVSEAHYPERLGHFFVLDPPSVFSVLWKMVQPWVDPVTKAKVTFCQFKPQTAMEEAMQKQHFGAELITWLKDEMAENRSKKVKAKVYSYQQLAEIVQQPRPTDSEEESGHCVYGTRSLLKFLRKQPGVLDVPHSLVEGDSVEQ